MKAALDVHYENDGAIAACVVFKSYQDSEPSDVIRSIVPASKEYYAGRFYQRELPCLLAVLKKADREFQSIIIDGYVHLKPDIGKGLGTHLYESLSYDTEIIGVAKNSLKIADRFFSIKRGQSQKPLYISAIGCPLENAVQSILSMHGPYRIPALLKLADQYARSD